MTGDQRGVMVICNYSTKGYCGEGMRNTLIDEPVTVWSSDRSWYCIYTKPKQEDLLCMRLSEICEIELFNPKLRRRKLVRGKALEVVEEFFPCYMFAMFDPKKYYHMIKYTRGVKRVVGDTFGIPYVVDESIIESMKSRMSNGCISLDPPRLSKGEKVTITDGPFKGMTGLFSEELKPRERVLILLNTIKYQAKVEIEPDFVVQQL